MKSRVLSSSDVDKKLISYVSDLDEYVNLLFDGKSTIAYTGGVIGLAPIDILRMTGECPLSNTNDILLRNVLINSIITSENKWSCSGVITVLAFLEMSKYLIKRKKLRNNETLNDIDVIISRLSKQTRRCSSSQALTICENIMKDDLSSHAVKKTVQMSGADGQIHFVQRDSPSSYIRVKSGYKFLKCDIPEIFQKEYSNLPWIRSNPKVLIIDGIVESIGSIHNILDASIKDHDSCVIIARGFGGDVENTLAVNMSYGRLNVFPIAVQSDEIGANQLFDIAAVCNADVVSSLKGDVISCKTFEDLVSIDEIEITDRGVTIYNDTTKTLVAKRRSSLKKKLGNIDTSNGFDSAEFQRNMFSERIRSLIDKGVELNVGSDFGVSSGITRDRIESGIRVYRDSCRHGIISTSDSINYLPRHLRSIASRLESAGIYNMSAPGFLAGLKIGHQTAITCSRVGAWVVCDESY